MPDETPKHWKMVKVVPCPYDGDRCIFPNFCFRLVNDTILISCDRFKGVVKVDKKGVIKDGKE
ncbi:MAG: hypothetical protein JSW06_04285 [Thermoplasmatales archaeon]|nr:MAG: hypothetical protein JSW06_04285 [Thermoplasmatales archaeon]